MSTLPLQTPSLCHHIEYCPFSQWTDGYTIQMTVGFRVLQIWNHFFSYFHTCFRFHACRPHLHNPVSVSPGSVLSTVHVELNHCIFTSVQNFILDQSFPGVCLLNLMSHFPSYLLPLIPGLIHPRKFSFRIDVGYQIIFDPG